jgi:hypothetical protein
MEICTSMKFFNVKKQVFPWIENEVCQVGIKDHLMNKFLKEGFPITWYNLSNETCFE